MAENTYPAEPHRLSLSRLLYGFSAAAAAWALEGVVGVVVSSQFCPADLPHWGLASETSVKVALGIVTLALLAIAVSAGLVSLRNWRTLAGQREFAHAEGISREGFLAIAGIFISIVFTVAIIWSGISLIMLNECMRAR